MRFGPLPPSFQNTYSMKFDGMDDKVELGTQSFGITGAISVSAWVKIPTSNTGGGGTNIQVFVAEDRTSGTNRNWELAWRGGGLNRISGVIWDSLGTAVVATSTAIVPNDGVWHHLMFTYTGDTSVDGLKLFIDGIQRMQATSANGGLRSTTAVIPTIGSLSQIIQWQFEGNIDEVSIFDTDQSSNIATLSTAPTVDLTSLNPLAWYRMGDNGAYKDPQWLIPSNENKDKVSNYSMEFDGVNDYIDLNRPTELISATNFSISCWFKTPLSALQGLFTWFSGASGWIELSTNPNGSLNAIVTNNGGGSATLGVTATGLITSDWTNIVMVFDGGGAANSDRLKLYINGSLITFASFSGTIPTQTGTMLSSGLHVGERYNGVNYFNGSIDSYSIFSNSLTQQNVTDIYNGGTPTTISGAISHYKMGEDATFSGGVWTVPDEVGANDGTSTNMTIEDRVGTAPSSSNNALSFNMDEIDRKLDTPPS